MLLAVLAPRNSYAAVATKTPKDVDKTVEINSLLTLKAGNPIIKIIKLDILKGVNFPSSR